MSSTESDDESTIFAGLTVFIHGNWAGRTFGRVARVVKENGGRVVKDVTHRDLSHAIIGGQIWARQGTVGADLTVRAILTANEENRSEEDEDQNRVWLLPLEWLETSIEKGRKLRERKWDFERTDGERKADRARELALEKMQNGGQSRFKRGERKVWEREQELKKELALQAKIDKEGGAPGLEAFSGLPSNPAPSTAASTSLMQEDLKPKPESSAPTSAETKDKAARAAERRAKENREAAALADSKPLKPTVSSSKATDRGDKKPKLKAKSRSSASVIPIIHDSSDEDLPLAVGMRKPDASDKGSAAAGPAKKRALDVVVLGSDSDSEAARPLKLKKKLKKKEKERALEVSPEL
ncbi:hypothetical protein JCM9279_005663 [Rhodotorula babjevae]